ncbi:MAG: hypothetical protein ACRCXL_13520 [Dermatophilaceae bacterium]
MRHHFARPSAAAAALVLLLAACSEDTEPAPDRPEPSASTSAPASPPSSGSGPAASGPPSRFTLTRTGGPTEFADVLFVQSDGAVVGSTNAGAVDCRAPAELTEALANGRPPSAPAAGEDRAAVVLVRSNGEVPLGEARGSDAVSKAARALLDDLQRTDDARTVCR